MARVASWLVRWGLTALAVVVAVYPLLFMIQTSLRTQMDFLVGGLWRVPTDPVWTHYASVLRAGFTRYLANTALVASTSVLAIAALGAMAAYVLARSRLFGLRLLFVLFVAGMLIPVHITLIPVYVLTRVLGLYDSLLGLIGPYVAFNLPVTIFILTGFFRDFPAELEEAAAIDGCSPARAFWSVVLPLSGPPLLTVVIYNLVILWNEFIFALVLTSSPSRWILTLGLWNFQGQYGLNVPAIMASVALSVLPLIVLYLVGQEKVMRGMLGGALKG
ncbi:carbohydrate ABC transporter permease [Geochorda subterranea]|uniref:Carbohydrate ABC transporter permease n=1 Tax=Geochorda subterranea TaxID=3109564 RepID=A0ABZ1BNI5_9FIRM|nr:carbohydrate ABC transporter permease [Limnochorda sp. LNt]WRP14357.1 carbohydrate ABC transporter permease [Limnochorda sp. LNt]